MTDTMTIHSDSKRRGLAARFGRLFSAFVADKRGGTAVQAIVLLPVIFLAFGLGARLWQTITIRQSLHSGVYEATRYLSMYPPDTTDTYVWNEMAEKLIHAELANNPFVDDTKLIPGGPWTRVQVNLTSGGFACKDNFTVSAQYPVFGARPTEGDSLFVLPSGREIVLREQRTGEVLCD
ncbi:MAG: TadE/TadG family type IV pilus assembly protein [Anaerolineae bacterium]